MHDAKAKFAMYMYISCPCMEVAYCCNVVERGYSDKERQWRHQYERGEQQDDVKCQIIGEVVTVNI